jgi:Tol biopolymer transport system component
MPTTGGAVDTLLISPVDQRFPAWSPDGTKLIFSSDRALRLEKYNLYMWDLSKAGS